jgi:large subunit ribosomal protein L4
MGFDSVLVITDAVDENVFLAARNLPNVLVLEVHQADPVSLVRFGKVLMTRAAVAKFEEMLG